MVFPTISLIRQRSLTRYLLASTGLILMLPIATTATAQDGCFVDSNGIRACPVGPLPSVPQSGASHGPTGPSPREVERARQEQERYNALWVEADRVIAETRAATTTEAVIAGQRRLLDINRRAQKMRNGRNVRNAIRVLTEGIRKNEAISRNEARENQAAERDLQVMSRRDEKRQIARSVARRALDKKFGDPGNIEIYSQAIKILVNDKSGDRGDIYYHRALEYFSNREYRRAVSDLSNSINDAMHESGTANPMSYGFRADAYAALKDWKHAIADWNEVIRLEPNNEGAYMARAAVSLKQGDYGRAVADYTRAISMLDELLRKDPNHPYAGEARAEASVELARASQGVTQTNPGADTREGTAIRNETPRQGGVVAASSALDQGRIAGTGKASTGRVMDGGTAHNDTTATGTLVIVPTPKAVLVLSDADLAWYNKQAGFEAANAALARAADTRARAEQRLKYLDRQIDAAPSLAAKSVLVINRSEALKAEQAAKDAEVIAENARAQLIETLPGPPIMRPRSKRK